MGTILGNILALLLIVVAALSGVHSFEASIIAFLAISYVSLILGYFLTFFLGQNAKRSRFSDSHLSSSEARVFGKYFIFIWAPSVGRLISAFLNLFRVAGIIWAGLAFWNAMYLEGALCGALFFLNGILCLRTDPVLYMQRQAGQGLDVARSELAMIARVEGKLRAYRGNREQDRPTHTDKKSSSDRTIQRLIGEFKDQIQDWPSAQAQMALTLVSKTLQGEEFDFDELTSRMLVKYLERTFEFLDNLDEAIKSSTTFWSDCDVGVVRVEEDGSAVASNGTKSWPVDWAEFIRKPRLRKLSEAEYNAELEGMRAAKAELERMLGSSTGSH